MVPFYKFHHQEDDSKHILLRVFLVGNLISYISSKTRKCIFLVVMCILLDTGFDTIPLKKRFTFSQWSKRILQYNGVNKSYIIYVFLLPSRDVPFQYTWFVWSLAVQPMRFHNLQPLMPKIK